MPFFLFNPPLETCGKRVTVKYTHNAHITNIEEVKDFFRHVVHDLGINIHPDDDFKDYVSPETGLRIMDDMQAEHYNRLMDEAFGICGDEVYSIAYGILTERLQQ